MIIISHRGNTEGHDSKTANCPDHISKVLETGLHCEVDVWKIKDKELGKSLRSDFTLAGWLGFLTGMILMFADFSSGDINNLTGGFSSASITILYGYFMGATAEAFFTE